MISGWMLRFCMYNFWNMQIPRIVLVIYFMVMLSSCCVGAGSRAPQVFGSGYRNRKATYERREISWTIMDMSQI